MKQNNCCFDKIFVTHSHKDHYAGAYDLVMLMKELNLPLPRILKKLTKDFCDLRRIIEHPELEKYLWNIDEGDTF